MYSFTNKEFADLCEAINTDNKIKQLVCVEIAQMKKAKEMNKTRIRVNKMRKINKNYGRTKRK